MGGRPHRVSPARPRAAGCRARAWPGQRGSGRSADSGTAPRAAATSARARSSAAGRGASGASSGTAPRCSPSHRGRPSRAARRGGNRSRPRPADGPSRTCTLPFQAGRHRLRPQLLALGDLALTPAGSVVYSSAIPDITPAPGWAARSRLPLRGVPLAVFALDRLDRDDRLSRPPSRPARTASCAGSGPRRACPSPW